MVQGLLHSNGFQKQPTIKVLILLRPQEVHSIGLKVHFILYLERQRAEDEVSKEQNVETEGH